MRSFELISLLSDGRFHSGESLGEQLGISRSGVWKALKALDAWGIEVYSVKGKGYRLASPIELLNPAKIRENLSHPASEQLARLDILPEIDSTNRFLLSNTHTEYSAVSAVFAERQSAGRGRRGKSWVSPFGHNLYFSLAWRFANGLRGLDGLSLVVGICLIRAFAQLGVQDIGLKWPNDIYWNGQKLCGILIEVSGESSGPMRIVLGVGINIRMASPQATQIDQPWTDLATVCTQELPSRNEIAGLVLTQIIEGLALFERSGWPAFEKYWREFDILCGQAVTVHLAGELITGTAEGVDSQGALLVRTTAGLRRFLSGEVSVRTAS